MFFVYFYFSFAFNTFVLSSGAFLVKNFTGIIFSRSYCYFAVGIIMLSVCLSVTWCIIALGVGVEVRS